MKTKKIMAGLLLMACLLLQNAAFSQTVQLPSNSDRIWGSSNTTIDGINTAMIDIDTADNANGSLDRLAACAFYGSGGANPGGIIVTDLTHGYTVNVTYPVGGSGLMASTPDIIIGNNVNSAHPKEDFIMAVTFINVNGDVEIDYFDIHYTTPWTVFTVTYNSNNIVSMVAGYIPYHTAHIDVVADHVATPLYGIRPVCDSFFVAFDVLNIGGPGGAAPDAHAAMGSLGAYSVGGAVDVTNTVHVIDNEEPDVAGVQVRQMGGAVHDVARIVWRGQGAATIYEADWDPTAGTIIGSTLSNSLTQYYYHPRIDADDDYTTNNSVANANWKVATEVYYYGPPSSEERIYTFDDLGGPYQTSVSMATTISLFTSCATNYYYLPAVAFGPRGGNHYMVTEYMEEQCASGDYVVMEPIDKSAPNIAPDPPPSPLNSCFEISNLHSSVTAGVGLCNYANSVSTPCNNVSDSSLIAWAFYDAMSTTYYIDFKTNLYTNAGHGYAYKTLPNETQALLITGESVSVFPNPAVDHITISDPGKTAESYRIINVLGQQVGGAMITATETAIELNDLPAGSYIVTLYRKENICGKQVFVKK
jgi:hypothetical protein